jgi:hypothetical protein
MHSDDVRARIEVEPMPRCAFCNPETCGCPDYRVTVNGDSWNSGDLEYCALFAEKVLAFADAAHADMAGEVRELVEAARGVERRLIPLLSGKLHDIDHADFVAFFAALAKFHPTHQETKA